MTMAYAIRTHAQFNATTERALGMQTVRIAAALADRRQTLRHTWPLCAQRNAAVCNAIVALTHPTRYSDNKRSLRWHRRELFCVDNTNGREMVRRTKYKLLGNQTALRQSQTDVDGGRQTADNSNSAIYKLMAIRARGGRGGGGLAGWLKLDNQAASSVPCHSSLVAAVKARTNISLHTNANLLCHA